MSDRDAEMDEEMREHVRLLTEQGVRRGMTSEEARRAALLAFGSTETLQETARGQRPGAWLADLGRDLSYGVRMLRAQPGFTLVVILTLALGIGANATIFGLINAVFLRPLAVRDPDGLVLFSEGFGGGLRRGPIRGRLDFYAEPLYQRLRDQNQAFEGIAAQQSGPMRAILRWQGAQEPPAGDLANGRAVSANYFDVLGVPPAGGRTFLPTEETGPGANPVIVLSHGYWQRRFEGNPAVIGSQVTVNETPFTVVGIAGPGFSGTAVGDVTDFWVPLTMVADSSWLGARNSRWLFIIGRLKRHMSLATAQASVNVTLQQYLAEEPASQKQAAEYRRAYVQLESGATGMGSLRRNLKGPLLALMVGVGLLLLIVCLNLAHLLLARSITRQREVSTRVALGASRARLVRQLLAEGLLVSFVADAAGALTANWVGKALLALLPDIGPLDLGTDVRVLTFTALLGLGTTVVVGLIPAWQAARAETATTLRSTSATVAGGRQRLASRLLLASQVALSLVLLVGSGLLASSLFKLRDVDKGFDDRNLLQVEMFIRLPGLSPEQEVTLNDDLLRRLAALPGVRSVSQAAMGLLTGSQSTDDVQIPGTAIRGEVDFGVVTPSYFETVGMSLLRGRTFTDHDNRTAPRVALVNEAFAMRFFGGVDAALGKRVARRDGEFEVVGVLRDARPIYLRWDHRPFVYRPVAQLPTFLGSLQLRVDDRVVDLSALTDALRQEVRATHPGLRVLSIRTVRSEAERSLSQERMLAAQSIAFGFAALFLVCVGLYGVISQWAGQRGTEIGVRIALGATRGGVRWMVLRQGFGLVLAGLAVGIPSAIATSRLLQGFLFGIDPMNPAMLSTAALAILLVAAVAAFLPARRASAVDPVVALRHD